MNSNAGRHAGDFEQRRRPNRRPIATYSIVARDENGVLGVAVQSHWYNVGAVVPWVAPGVGAVAVQSISPPTVGPGIIERLQEGETASGALEMALEDGDGDAAYMQIGVVDGSGGVAVHTGRLCIAEAGHVSGDGFSVQANMMAKPTVWPAMADAYQSGSGDLADRLLRALQAAEAEGGDIRGRQSAAIVVEPVDGKGDRFDLRVEDSPDPLDELSRLIELQRAYIELNRGDARIAEGDITSALEAYRKATELVPDEATGGEAAFWVGVALAGEGRVQEARSYLARAIDINPTWVELLPRLVASKLLPDDEDLLHALRGV
jgi:uncharacterized Ntn-hydrolase superfamily protein